MSPGHPQCVECGCGQVEGQWGCIDGQCVPLEGGEFATRQDCESSGCTGCTLQTCGTVCLPADVNGVVSPWSATEYKVVVEGLDCEEVNAAYYVCATGCSARLEFVLPQHGETVMQLNWRSDTFLGPYALNVSIVAGVSFIGNWALYSTVPMDCTTMNQTILPPDTFLQNPAVCDYVNSVVRVTSLVY